MQPEGIKNSVNVGLWTETQPLVFLRASEFKVSQVDSVTLGLEFEPVFLQCDRTE